MPSIRYGSKISGFTSRIFSRPKFFAIWTALAMLTMSCGVTSTRMGEGWGCTTFPAAQLPSHLTQERRVVLLGFERGGEALLLHRFHVGFLWFYQAGIHQLDQRVIQGDHARLPVGLHDGGDLERLTFSNEVGYRGDRQQDLTRGDSPAPDLLTERLGNHSPQGFGEHDPDLRLPVGRKLIDDPVDGRGGGRGMESSKHEVAGFRRLNRYRYCFQVPHLAHQDNVRIFAQSSPESVLERPSVNPDLPLGDQAFLTGMHEFDRIFDGNDVIGASPVDQVDQSRQRGAFARAGRPSDHD